MAYLPLAVHAAEAAAASEVAAGGKLCLLLLLLPHFSLSLSLHAAESGRPLPELLRACVPAVLGTLPASEAEAAPSFAAEDRPARPLITTAASEELGTLHNATLSVYTSHAMFHSIPCAC